MRGRLRGWRLAPLPLAAAWLAGCWTAASGAALPRALVTVAGHRIQVEVADSRATRIQGLSGRRALAADRGMLFAYDVANVPAFWMKGMRFDLDLVWIRGGRIVDLTPRAPHQVAGPLPIYRPSAPVDLVLEVPAGTVERLGWHRGDPVVVEPPWPHPAGDTP